MKLHEVRRRYSKLQKPKPPKAPQNFASITWVAAGDPVGHTQTLFGLEAKKGEVHILIRPNGGESVDTPDQGMPCCIVEKTKTGVQTTKYTVLAKTVQQADSSYRLALLLGEFGLTHAFQQNTCSTCFHWAGTKETLGARNCSHTGKATNGTYSCPDHEPQNNICPICDWRHIDGSFADPASCPEIGKGFICPRHKAPPHHASCRCSIDLGPVVSAVSWPEAEVKSVPSYYPNIGRLCHTCRHYVTDGAPPCSKELTLLPSGSCRKFESLASRPPGLT